ncbi:MAG: maleylpyruvate isomerase family mycothiol-dependent enzyme [Streptosporangiales bacterium]|nr:maleylpyruvate isomerase family mycothiol-dependent enzyme [Streptosporangiales bacterium]
MEPFGPRVETRPVFPAQRASLLALLGSLTPAEWSRPTVCPGWNVHDVTAHILHDHLRRLSAGRDGHPGSVLAPDETLPVHLARVNEEFVRVARGVSPAVLTELLGDAGPRLDAYWSGVDLDAPAVLDVSWASTDLPSPAWLDVAREYTEFWVHEQQIRDATGRPGGDGPELLGPVVDAFLRALPKALEAEERAAGTTVRFDVTGPAGGTWYAVRGPARWHVDRGGAPDEGAAGADAPPAAGGPPAACVTVDQDTVWRLGSRGITVEQARERATVAGDPALAAAATTLLAIIW